MTPRRTRARSSRALETRDEAPRRPSRPFDPQPPVGRRAFPARPEAPELHRQPARCSAQAGHFNDFVQVVRLRAGIRQSARDCNRRHTRLCITRRGDLQFAVTAFPRLRQPRRRAGASSGQEKIRRGTPGLPALPRSCGSPVAAGALFFPTWNSAPFWTSTTWTWTRSLPRTDSGQTSR